MPHFDKRRIRNVTPCRYGPKMKGSANYHNGSVNANNIFYFLQNINLRCFQIEKPMFKQSFVISASFGLSVPKSLPDLKSTDGKGEDSPNLFSCREGEPVGKVNICVGPQVGLRPSSYARTGECACRPADARIWFRLTRRIGSSILPPKKKQFPTF